MQLTTLENSIKKSPCREYADLPMEYYHDIRTGLSKSALCKLIRSPYHFYRTYLAPDAEPQKSTAATMLGSAVHTLILEPQKWDEEYHVADVASRNAKAYKEAVVNHPEKTILVREESEQAHRMADAVWSHKLARHYLELPGKSEQSFFWKDRITGVPVKARPDRITDDSSIILDPKTCRSAQHDFFRADADKLLYFLSAGMTLHGVHTVRRKRPEAYIFLCIENEKTKHPAVALYHATEEEIILGEHYYLKSLQIFQECMESQFWPMYSPRCEALGLTRYRRKELEKLRKAGKLLYAE